MNIFQQKETEIKAAQLLFADCMFCGTRYYREDGHSCSSSVAFQRTTDAVTSLRKEVNEMTSHMDLNQLIGLVQYAKTLG